MNRPYDLTPAVHKLQAVLYAPDYWQDAAFGIGFDKHGLVINNKSVRRRRKRCPLCRRKPKRRRD